MLGDIGDTVVLGISPDKPSKQLKFAEKYGLGFPLLSDPDHAVAEAFGVWKEKTMYGRKYMGIVRSAFLIDEKGKIAEAWYKISPADTPKNLLAAAGVSDSRAAGAGRRPPAPAAVPVRRRTDGAWCRGSRRPGTWRLPGDEWFFPGHFPGRPTLPGVLMCEAIAQVGAIAVLTDERFAGKLPLFGGLDGARFRRQVGPGDELTLEVDARPDVGPRRQGQRARPLLGGQVACSCDLLFVVVDA